MNSPSPEHQVVSPRDGKKDRRHNGNSSNNNSRNNSGTVKVSSVLSHHENQLSTVSGSINQPPIAMEKYRLIEEHKGEGEDFLESTNEYEVRITQQGKPRNFISYAMGLLVSERQMIRRHVHLDVPECVRHSRS